MSIVLSAFALGLAAFTPTVGARTDLKPATLLVLGDSLSAEYGIRRGTGWVALLEKRLHEKGYFYQVVNRSISGETTSGGLSRLPQILRETPPKMLVLALGANDALRGFDLRTTEKNLGEMVRMAKAVGADVVLVGMRMPPNFGPQYTQQFYNLFAQLAEREATAYVPFLLEAVASDMGYFQPDRLHPTEAAHPLILDTVWPALEKRLAKTRGAKPR